MVTSLRAYIAQNITLTTVASSISTRAPAQHRRIAPTTASRGPNHAPCSSHPSHHRSHARDVLGKGPQPRPVAHQIPLTEARRVDRTCDRATKASGPPRERAGSAHGGRSVVMHPRDHARGRRGASGGGASLGLGALRAQKDGRMQGDAREPTCRQGPCVRAVCAILPAGPLRARTRSLEACVVRYRRGSCGGTGRCPAVDRRGSCRARVEQRFIRLAEDFVATTRARMLCCGQPVLSAGGVARHSQSQWSPEECGHVGHIPMV